MFGNVPLSVMLFIIYFLTAPFALYQSKKRMKFSRAEELAIFKNQLKRLGNVK